MHPRTVKVYTENNTFQYIDTLRRRREKRHKHREFFVEGVRQINAALVYGWAINAFVYSRERRLSDWAEGVLGRSSAALHIEVTQPLLAKLSDKDDTSELLALMAMPNDDLARIPLTRSMSVIVFDRPANPGNLGTLIRSCDALRVDGVIITGHAVDLYDPETIRATVGSFFAVPVVRALGPGDLVPWFDTVRRVIGALQIVGTSAKAGSDIAAHDFTGPTILLVGNETWGLSAPFRHLCDAMVTIPMHGSATSLNVACAASIMLYEINKQRRARP